MFWIYVLAGLGLLLGAMYWYDRRRSRPLEQRGDGKSGGSDVTSFVGRWYPPHGGGTD